MKKFQYLVLLLIVVGYIGVRWYNDSLSNDDKITQSAKGFINQVVPEITQNWSPKKLQEYASPRLTQLIKANISYWNRFEELKKLGKYRGMSIDSGSVSKVRTIQDRTETIGTFKVSADFEKASATITIQLILVEDRWRILVFNVFTPMRLT